MLTNSTQIDSPVLATIKLLGRAVIVKRLSQHGLHPPGYFIHDSFWLVDMAINRRAGWQDDLGHTRGSCMPVNGKYPKKAIGETFNNLRRLAGNINRPRLIVRERELGEWKKLLMKRLPHRFSEDSYAD